jgi:hypothetical protein
MTDIETPPVGAGGEGRISEAVNTSLPIASMQPRVQPLTFAEFITIGRLVTQDTGRNRWAMVRFNAYVDIDMELYSRPSHPEPTSWDELQAFMRGVDGRKCYTNRIRNIWLDYQRAREACAKFRGGGRTP